MEDTLGSNWGSLLAVRHGVLVKCGWGVTWYLLTRRGKATIYNSGGAVFLDS